jgi:hypothetical protein
VVVLRIISEIYLTNLHTYQLISCCMWQILMRRSKLKVAEISRVVTR